MSTQLATDNFPGASLNAAWTTITSCSAIKAASGLGEPSATGVNCGALWGGGISWPADQYAEIVIGAGYNNQNYIIPTVRSDGSSATAGYQLVLLRPAGGGCYISRNGTNLTSSSITPAVGDVWRLTAFGDLIIAYQNGKKVLEIRDHTVTTGSPGIVFFVATGTIANDAISLFSAGNAAGDKTGVWTKFGLVMLPTATDSASAINGTANQTMLYEGGSQLGLGAGSVFKMWFQGGPHIYYAESLDGKAWTRQGAAVISNKQIPGIFKNGSTYYLYVSHDVNWLTIDLYTSPDGLVWTLANTNILNNLGNASYLRVVDIVTGTWRAMVGGLAGGTHLITSADGVTWADGGVINNDSSGFNVHKIGDTYVGYATTWNPGEGSTNGFDPTTFARYTSTDLKTWSGKVFVIQPDEAYEGVSDKNAEVSVSSVIEANGSTYLYYSATSNGGTYSIDFQICGAVAPYTISQLVAMGEEYFSSYRSVASDAFQRADGALGANWTDTSAAHLQIVSHFVEPTTLDVGNIAMYTGAAFANDQYCEATLHSLTLSTCNLFLAVRVTGNLAAYYAWYIPGPTNSAVVSAVYCSAAGVTCPSYTITPQVGDVFRLSIVDNVLSGFQNGLLVFQFTDAQRLGPTSGSPSIRIIGHTAAANASISAWAGGNSSITAVIAYKDSNGIAISDGGLVYTTMSTTGAIKNSSGFLVASDGSLVISTSKAAGAYVNSSGLTINPDGSLVTKASADAGGLVNSFGFLINPDGSLVTSAVKDATAVRKSRSPGGAWYVNSNGALVIV